MGFTTRGFWKITDTFDPYDINRMSECIDYYLNPKKRLNEIEKLKNFLKLLVEKNQHNNL